MDDDTQRARQDLDLLPFSEKKSDVLRLLAEIEKSEAEEKVLLEKLDQTLEKCRLTEKEQRFYRWLGWFGIALGLMATYGGIEAIISREFCSVSRGSWSCTHGLNAQINGVAELFIGALLLIVPLPDGRWRTFGLWIFGLSLVPAVFGSILVG